MQNRVSEIRCLIPAGHWRHCPGIENPADVLSRGTSPVKLGTNALWRDGPSIPPASAWMLDDGGGQSEDMPPECAAELRASNRPSTIGLLTREVDDVSNIVKVEDFSNLNHLIGVVTRVLSWYTILRKKINPDRRTTFDGSEREVAETLLIRSAQSYLKENEKFKQWEKQLRVFTDQEGVMRCQGRIDNAEKVPYSSKYPILLPNDHHLTKLYVHNAHARVLHNGVKATITELRSRFWLVKGRSTVKKIL